jgi:PPM family protein phosphatase
VSDIIREVMLEAFGVSDAGCVRPNNEDTYLIDEKRGLFLLADGMGGAQAGETASHTAVEIVAAAVGEAESRTIDSLAEAFQKANREVVGMAASDPQLTGMGTTLVALMDCGGQMAIASVGDSRAYLFEGGVLTQLTEDQTWSQEVGRRIGISEEHLKKHPMRHVLTMAIGVDRLLRVHKTELSPEPGAILLLCSDGLHGVVPPETITEGLISGQSLEAKCHYLIDAARKAGGPDNVTVVLIRKIQ